MITQFCRPLYVITVVLLEHRWECREDLDVANLTEIELIHCTPTARSCAARHLESSPEIRAALPLCIAILFLVA